MSDESHDLSYFSIPGFVKCVEYLILIGAAVNCGEEKSTPLMIAVQNEDVALVQLLLLHNVNNVKTALQWCLNEEKWKLAGENV